MRDLLDREQQIETAGLVVHRYLSLDHDPAPLIAELGHLLLREDGEFHSYQMLEAGVALHGELAPEDPVGGGSCPGRGGSLSGGARSDQPGHAANGEDGAPAAPG